MAVGEKCRGPLSFLFHVFPFFCLVVASSSSVGRHAFMHRGCGGTDQARRGNERKNTEREVSPSSLKDAERKAEAEKRLLQMKNVFSLLGNKLFVFIERV